MPLRRKYAPKRRLIRRRQLARPMRRMPRQPNVYHFKRKFFLIDAIVVNSGVDDKRGIGFALQNLPNFTDFTNLYDMYRINKVVYKIIPKYTQQTITALTNNVQQIHSVLDYDDITAPGTISDLTQYQNHKMTRGNQIHTRVIVPKVLNTTAGLNTAPKSYQWLDCDNTGIVHRGLKLYIPAPGSAGLTLSYDVEATFYVSFKHVV